MPYPFGAGERFNSSRDNFTPGPGSYDPKHNNKRAEFKTFKVGERFVDDEGDGAVARGSQSADPKRTAAVSAQRIRELERQLDEANKRIKKLEHELKSDHAVFDATLKKKVAECAELEDQLRAAQAAKQQLQRESEEAAEQLMKMSETYEQMRSELHSAQRRAGEAEKSLRGLQDVTHKDAARYAELVESHEAMQQQHGALQATYADAQHCIRDAEELICELQADLQKSRGEKDALSTKLNAHSTTVTKLTEELRTMTHAVEQLTAELKKLESEKDEGRAEMAAMNAQLRASQSEVVQLTMKLEEASEELAVARQHLEDADRALETEQKQRGNMERRMKLMSQTHHDVSGEVASLQTQLEELEFAKAAVEAELKSMERRMAEETAARERAEIDLVAAKSELLSFDTRDQDVEAGLHAEVEAAYAALRNETMKREAAEAAYEDARRQLADMASDGANTDARIKVLEEQLEEERRKCAGMSQTAAANRADALNSRTMELETQRLTDDNAVMSLRLEQLEDHIRELMGTGQTGLGHNNPRQKIQYHLRLKQELEEMRRECTLLLRERFHLEQCVRYLAARAKMDVTSSPATAGTGMGWYKEAADVLQPASLAQNYIGATDIGRRQMKLAGRGRMSTKESPIYKTKTEMEADILHARQATAQLLVKHLADATDATTPPAKQSTAYHNGNAENDSSKTNVTPKQQGPSTPAPRTPGTGGAGQNGVQTPVMQGHAEGDGATRVEDRILAKISAICSPHSNRSNKALQTLKGSASVAVA